MPAYRLGCASSYRAAIKRQGGALWTWVDGLDTIKWGRKRDDYSEASITVSKTLAGSSCCNKLADTHSWAHELAILRDDQLVWEGPITRRIERRASFSFEARDMIAWLDRRTIKPAGASYHWTVPTDTGLIIRTMISDAFPLATDPGLMPYAQLANTATNSTTDVLWKDTVHVGTAVRDLLEAGVDLYTVGRSIRVHSDKATTTPIRLVESDFLDDLEVRETGLDTATRAVVVGGQPLDPTTGQPIQDVAPILGVSGGYDTYYGLVENLTSSSGITDTAVANGIAAARRSYGYPPPIDLVVPSGAQLSPHAPADINQLIPGAPFLVEMGESYCSTIAQAYRLNELEVTWLASEVEQVAVSLASNGPILEVA
jgi:hypothetical protein